MDWLKQIGINLPDVVSGIAGGMVNALLFQRANPIAAVSSVFAGGLTSNYLAEAMAKQFSMNVGPSGFIIGLTAMIVCQGLMTGASKWASSQKGNDAVR